MPSPIRLALLQLPPIRPDSLGACWSTCSSSWGGIRGYSTAQNQPRNPQEPQVIQQVLRASHAAEAAALGFLQGQQWARCGRVDLAHFKDQEAEAFKQAQALLPQHRIRPSLLQGVLKLAATAAGVASGAAPRPVQLALWGAVSELMSEHYTESLREVRQHEALQAEAQADQAEGAQHNSQVDFQEIRHALRALRDVDRAPEGLPRAPDLLTLQKITSVEGLKEVGGSGVAALALKLVGRAAIDASAKL